MFLRLGPAGFIASCIAKDPVREHDEDLCPRPEIDIPPWLVEDAGECLGDFRGVIIADFKLHDRPGVRLIGGCSFWPEPVDLTGHKIQVTQASSDTNALHDQRTTEHGVQPGTAQLRCGARCAPFEHGTGTSAPTWLVVREMGWPGCGQSALLAGVASFDDPAFYGDRWADIYDERHGELDPAPAVEFLAGLAGGGRVLELATGTGRVALPLAARGRSRRPGCSPRRKAGR